MDCWWLKALHRCISQTSEISGHGAWVFWGTACCVKEGSTKSQLTVTGGISCPASSSLQLVLAGTKRSVNTYYSTHKSSDQCQHFPTALRQPEERKRYAVEYKNLTPKWWRGWSSESKWNYIVKGNGLYYTMRKYFQRKICLKKIIYILHFSLQM